MHKNGSSTDVKYFSDTRVSILSIGDGSVEIRISSPSPEEPERVLAIIPLTPHAASAIATNLEAIAQSQLALLAAREAQRQGSE